MDKKNKGDIRRTMSDLRISDISTMQKELQEKYKDHWRELTPENTRNRVTISLIKRSRNLSPLFLYYFL